MSSTNPQGGGLRIARWLASGALGLFVLAGNHTGAPLSLAVFRSATAASVLTTEQMGRIEVLIHRRLDASDGSFGPENAAPEVRRSTGPGERVGSARPGASTVNTPSPVHGGVAVTRPPVKPRETVAGSAAKFFVQLAAFRNEAYIGPAWQRLRCDHGEVLEGLKRTIERAETDRGLFHRLRVGPFETRDAAARICQALVQHREDCFVVPPKA